MKYNGKFLFGLLALVLLLACTQTPEQRAKDATVLIVTGKADGTVGNGSGFFVEPDKIATNIHVVAGEKMLFAVGTKKIYNIEKVTGYNPERDLVVLQVSGKGKLFELSEGKIDETIFAVGYPRGGYDRTEGTVHGIRESDGQLRLVAKGFPRNGDSVLAPGNSGGPVINNNGQVIGIAVGAAGEDFYDVIASSKLKPLLDSSNEENLSDWQKRKPILAYTYYAWAEKKVDSEDYKKAIKGFNKADEQYERYAKVYTRRGFAKRELGQYQSAIEDHKKEIELIPDNSLAYSSSGTTKLIRGSDGDYKAAIEDFNKALELNPDYARDYQNRGVAKVKLLNYAGAIQDYDKAIALNPKDADAYNNRGFAKLKIEDYAGAIEDYTETIRLKDGFVGAHFYRGVAKAEMPDPDYAGAIQDYDKAIALNPKDSQAYYYQGNAKKALGQDKDAKIDHAKAYYYWGNAHLNSRNYQAAIEKLDETIKLVQNRPEAYNSRGNAYRLRGEKDDYQEAIKNYDKAIEVYDAAVEPVYIEIHVIHNDRGLANAAVGNYDEAIKDYTKAIESKPDYAEAYYNRGVVQHDLSKYQEAVDDLSRAIKLKKSQDPPVIYTEAYEARGNTKEALGEEVNAKVDFVMAYYYWSNEAYKEGKCEEAIEKLNTVLDELEMDISYVYHARGKAKAKFGKSKADLGDLDGARKLYQEAIEDYDEAIKLEPENALYYQDRGMTRLLRGAIRVPNGMIEDYESAIADFTEAINRKSDLVDVYNQRGQAGCLLGYAKANRGATKEARKHYKLALEDFKEAINLDSDNAGYYKYLGLANAALGKAKAALSAFEKAKQLKEAKSEN